MSHRLYALLGALLLLSGCSLWQEEAAAPAISAGKRIAVLQNSTALTPDPVAAQLALKLPATEKNTAWPLVGGYPDQPPAHPDLQYPLERRWRASIGKGARGDIALLPPPVVLGRGLATLDGGGQVSLFDALTGERRWRVSILPEDATPPAVPGGLAHAGDVIIATSGLNEVVALKATDGGVVWRTALAAPARTPPTVANGHVLVVTADNELVTLNLTSGQQEWTHQGLAELTTLAGGAAPAVAGELVLAAYSTGELVALLADNGRVLWFDSLGGVSQPFAVASLADIVARPVIDNGIVFAISHNGTLAAINARSGQRLWSRAIGGTQQPWVASEWLFMLSNDNQLIALTRDGRVRWTRQLAKFEDPEDKDDPILWYGPVLAGGRLLVAGSNGELAQIAPETGAVVGQFDLGDAAMSAPVVANSTVFIMTQDGDVLAVQ